MCLTNDIPNEVNPMYFDTHAHYDDARFDADREAVLAALPDQGVSLVLNPGCNGPSSEMALGFADRCSHVYAAVGWHPQQAASFTPDSLNQLRTWAQHPKVRAIGEIGLDYYYDDGAPHALQHQVFRAQLELARELDLPVIVHDRDAHGDCLAIVREYPGLQGVFHCYSGSAEMARQLLDLGWYLSFTGAITFKNARKAPEVLALCPLDRMMLETDAPYLSPEPFRGKRCDSSLLPYTARRIAEVKGVSLETVAAATLDNGRRFFRIP